MAIKLTTTKQATADNGIKIVCYGQAGAGKTVLCATTPDHAKTVIISAEAGLLSIAEADISVIEITSFSRRFIGRLHMADPRPTRAVV